MRSSLLFKVCALLLAVPTLNACEGRWGKQGTSFAVPREVEPPVNAPTKTLEELAVPLEEAAAMQAEKEMYREEAVALIGMQPHRVKTHSGRRYHEDDTGKVYVSRTVSIGWFVDEEWGIGPNLLLIGGSTGRVDGHFLMLTFDALRGGILVDVKTDDVADVPVSELWVSLDKAMNAAAAGMTVYAMWTLAESAKGVEENTQDIADSADSIDQSVGGIENTVDTRTAPLEQLQGVDVQALESMIDRRVQEILGTRF